LGTFEARINEALFIVEATPAGVIVCRVVTVGVDEAIIILLLVGTETFTLAAALLVTFIAVPFAFGEATFATELFGFEIVTDCNDTVCGIMTCFPAETFTILPEGATLDLEEPKAFSKFPTNAFT